ncbi:cation transporter [Salinibacterium sp. SYSU T00001]|uniref:cation diffusion facilitator family transporter n=1 Tax=Homoserinimonas sedimenticola TaxID=2986805 RepID=UPI0022357443|nr:cation transporter [Salinibacterium sedimenticola]MCW4386548.1 cation transporter [Salinibacterium sedimenticola]
MTAALTDTRRATLHRRVRFIVGFTISYNVIEAIVAIWAGTMASSAALIGFGLDSIVEVLSALAVAWQFTRKDPERWEKVTVRAIGIAFFALAAYVIIDSVLSLTGAVEVDHSPLGIGIATLSLLVMPLLAWFEFRTGRELGSKSVMADAKQLLLCIYLSGTVLIGLLLNSLFGWAWADSVAALVVAVLAIREGIEAWRGDVESPFGVLGEMGKEEQSPSSPADGREAIRPVRSRGPASF